MVAAGKARSRAPETGVGVEAHWGYHLGQMELESRDSYTHNIPGLGATKTARIALGVAVVSLV